MELLELALQLGSLLAQFLELGALGGRQDRLSRLEFPDRGVEVVDRIRRLVDLLGDLAANLLVLDLGLVLHIQDELVGDRVGDIGGSLRILILRVDLDEQGVLDRA